MKAYSPINMSKLNCVKLNFRSKMFKIIIVSLFEVDLANIILSQLWWWVGRWSKRKLNSPQTPKLVGLSSELNFTKKLSKTRFG